MSLHKEGRGPPRGERDNREGKMEGERLSSIKGREEPLHGNVCRRIETEDGGNKNTILYWEKKKKQKR